MSKGDDILRKRERPSHHVHSEVPTRTVEEKREARRSEAVIAARKAIGVSPDDIRGALELMAADPVVEARYDQVFNEVLNS